MGKVFVAAVTLAALTGTAQAQDFGLQPNTVNVQPGLYVGAGGGITTPLSGANNAGVGWVVGGKVGYDFVGPRVDLDVGYGQMPPNVNIPGTAI